MAHEDLQQAGDDELGHYIAITQNSGMGDPTERIPACRAELAARGLWYCDHDDSVQPLEHCGICGRHYMYLTETE